MKTSAIVYLVKHDEYGYYADDFHQESGEEWVDDPAKAQIFMDAEIASVTRSHCRSLTGEDFTVLPFRLELDEGEDNYKDLDNNE